MLAALQRTAPRVIPAGRDFRRRLSAYHAATAPRSAVVEPGVVRRLCALAQIRAVCMLIP